MTSEPPQGEGSDYRCSVGGARGSLWEPVYGDHTELRSSKYINKIWDTTYKIKTGGVAASQEISVKDGKRDKESVSTVVFLPHKDPFFPIEVPYVFTRSVWCLMQL